MTVSQEALRCIANALLLQPKARQILIDLGHGPDAAGKLKVSSEVYTNGVYAPILTVR